MDDGLPVRVGWVLGLIGMLASGSVHPTAGESGPLIGAWGGGEVCSPMRSSTEFSHNVATFQNLDDEPARITGVLLVHAEGLRLAEAVVVPVGNLSNGSASGWPPSTAVNWELRQQAVGAHIPPARVDGTTEPKRWNVVLHLTRTDNRDPALLTSVRIDYRVGHRGFRVVSDHRLRVRKTCF